MSSDKLTIKRQDRTPSGSRRSYAAPAPWPSGLRRRSGFRFNICGSPADHAAFGCTRPVLPRLLVPLGLVTMMPGNASERSLLSIAPGFPARLSCCGAHRQTSSLRPPSAPAGNTAPTPGSVQNFTGIFAALERKPYLLHTLITSRLKIFVFPLQYLSLCGIISAEEAATASAPPCGSPHR